jgi:dihydroorotate dehydrogenase (NAD+) catalytic subunit
VPGGGPGAPGATAARIAQPAPPVPLDLSVDLGRGLFLRNPLLVASGAAGYGVELEDQLEPERLGALVTRGTTLRPRAGNAPPRMARTAAGILNGIGLHNPGLEVVLERYAEAWARWPLPVIVNLAADSTADFVELARRLEGVPGIAGIELNLSCPNGARGGTLFAVEADAAAALTAAVRRACDLPLLVKLSPAAPDPRSIAKAVADNGADAISAVNTLPGMILAADRTRPELGSTYGGLSGPALRPIALRIVHEISRSVRIPVVAMGGVTDLEDILDFLAVGAAAVGVATAAIADPALPGRLADELADECAARGLASHLSLIGTALSKRPPAPSARGAEYRP